MIPTAWREYWKFYRDERGVLAAGLVLSLGAPALIVPTVLLVRRAFDVVIPAGDPAQLGLLGLGLLGLTLAGEGLELAVRALTIRVTKTAVRELRGELLAHVAALPQTTADRMDHRALHACIVQDTDRIEALSSALLARFFPALVAGAAIGAVMLFLNWRLCLVLAVTAPLSLWAARALKRRLAASVRRFHRAFEGFSKGTLFVLEMLTFTRLHTAEAWELARQRRLHETARATSAEAAWLTTAGSALQNTIVATSGVIILVAGGAGVAAHTLSLGAMLSFYVAARAFHSQLRTVLQALPQVVAGHESLLALWRILGLDAAPVYAGKEHPALAGGVVLENVTFAYAAAPVLENVSLEIPAGRTLAITGPNGAGKSTLLHLLLGLHRPQSGRLLADGVAYDTLDLAALRRAMGVVAQDPVLFPGTILENLTYGTPGATLDEVRRAAKLAMADEFIAPLPLGYETPVGENGALLSGGQRQRLAMARALLRRPRLLILDEPTNHLDAPAVNRLLDNLRRLEPAPTIVIISHEPRVLAAADRVFHLPEKRLEIRPLPTAA